MKMTHSAKQAQSQSLGYELGQAVKILSLTQTDLMETVALEVNENPLLEEEFPGEVARDFSPESNVEASAPPPTLASHLLEQFCLEHTDNNEREIAHMIVHNMDEDGRLCLSLTEVSAATKQDFHLCQQVQEDIKGLDPIGCASDDLVDCLLAQARHMCEPGEIEILENMISHHLEGAAQGNQEQLAREMGLSVGEVAQAIQRLQQFHPKPGRLMSAHRTHYIVPDICVHKSGNELVVETSSEAKIPRLRITPNYGKILGKRATLPPRERAYMEEKLQRARLLVTSLEKRQRTILRLARRLVDYQRDFFLGDNPALLRPLTLKDMAMELGVHESTVSRASAGKYMLTPSSGILEFKYFFRRLPGNDGTEHIRSKILRLCAIEIPERPFSDKKIVELLGRGGISLGLKALTRHREALGIPPQKKRKMLAQKKNL